MLLIVGAPYFCMQSAFYYKMTILNTLQMYAQYFNPAITFFVQNPSAAADK